MYINKAAQIAVLSAAINLALNIGASAQTEPDKPRQNNAASASAGIEELRAEITAIKAEYEKRIRQLESRLEEIQTRMIRESESEAPAPATPPPVIQQTIPGVLNPAIAVVGNLVGRADSRKVFNDEGNRVDNKMILREAEVDFRVPVDPYADGVLITALESETPGRFSVGVEEGYVNIKKLPFLDHQPLGLKIKAGRFRPLFGKINVLHTHDLPQTYRPLPIQEFLGQEGFVGDGISANIFLPTPWENSSLDLTLEALTGGDIAFSPDPNSRVSYLGHLRYFTTFKNSHNLEFGWSSYFHPAGNNIQKADIHDLDFMYRWKPSRLGEWKSFVLGGEFMFARRVYPEAAESSDVEQSIRDLPPGRGKPFGYYLFTQWQFDKRTYAGVRMDQASVLFNPSLKRRSLTPYLSYYFSEFLRFRLNFEHRWSDLFTEDRRNSVFAELNFVFGSHPPEPFWVNK
jgi:hypothetical protein